MSSKLRVTLDGKNDVINVKDFLHVLRATVSLLNGLSEGGAKWSVGKTSHSSPLNVEVVGDSQPIALLMAGIAELQRGERRPAHFSEPHFKLAKSLVRPLNDDLTVLILDSDGFEPIRATLQVAVSADRYIERRSYSAYTDIEGTLIEVRAADGKAEFQIRDELSGRPTTCKFDIQHADKVGSYITHRIRVWGTARYDKTDHPVEIAVEDWTPISSVPIEDLHKAGFRLTGDADSKTLIRRLRDLNG